MGSAVDGSIEATPFILTPTLPPFPSQTKPKTHNSRGHLLATLQDAARAAGAELRAGETIRDFDVVGGGKVQVHVTTTTTTGGSSSRSLPPADVLIGAEGMGSPSAPASVVRRKLLQRGHGDVSSGAVMPASRGYVVYRGVAPAAAGAAGGQKGPLAPGFSFQVCDEVYASTVHGVGWSTALIREYTHIHTHISHTRTQTWGPASRFASVPLADGQVWFATLPHTTTSSSTNAHSLLLDHFRRWHDPIPALLAATPPAAILRDDAVAHRVFPPFNSEHQSQPSWPVTLIGDAAHGVDPILAQGAGVAVEDAFHLAGALGGLKGGKDGALDVGAALRCVYCVWGVWGVVGVWLS